MTYGVSYLAVLVAAIVSMVIGMVWYAPAVFGKVWMKLSGISDSKMSEMKSKGMAKSYVINFIAALVVACVLGRFINAMGASDMMSAFRVVKWVWLVVAGASVGMVLWEGRPWKLYLINVGYHLLSFLATAIVFVMWK